MIHKIHNSHDMSVQWRLLLERHVCNTSIDGPRGARIAPEGIIHLKKIINNHNFNGLNPSQCEKFISTHRLLMKTPNWNHSLWSWFLSLTQRCLKIQLSWAPFYSKTPDTIGKCCEHHILCDWNVYILSPTSGCQRKGNSRNKTIHPEASHEEWEKSVCGLPNCQLLTSGSCSTLKKDSGVSH